MNQKRASKEYTHQVPGQGLTVLWGAGSGLEFWLERLGTPTNCIIVDVDEEKVGQRFRGIEIYHVGSLTNLSERVEEIIVMHSDAVAVRELIRSSQALQHCKVTFPPKRLLSADAFSSTEEQEAALLWACDFFRGTEFAGLTPTLEFGALLGLMRSNSLIPWDNDIDVSFAAESYDSVAQFVRRWSTATGSSTQGLRITHPEFLFFIDICFRRSANGGMSHSTAGPLGSVPEECLFPRRALVAVPDLFGPAQPERYLQAVYGDGWKTPDASFSFADYFPLVNRTGNGGHSSL